MRSSESDILEFNLKEYPIYSTSFEVLSIPETALQKGVLIRNNNGYIYKEKKGKNLYLKIDVDENGKANGKMIRYYENSTLMCEVSDYSNGVNHGKRIVYNRNGTKMIESEYKKGKKHGHYKEWQQTGNILVVHEVYKNGKLRERLFPKKYTEDYI